MKDNNLHVLIPNKNSSRFFGVDFFASLVTGSNPDFAYYSTSIDFNQVYRNEIISFSELKLASFESELSAKEHNYIIGFNQNPDIYDSVDSLKPIIDILKKYQMGMYLETNSPKIIDDLEILKDFAKELPLLITIPVTIHNNKINKKLLPKATSIDNIAKFANKLANTKINFGFIIKPIIPYLNDGVDEFIALTNKLVEFSPKFIYPSFSLNFDSAKIEAFYDIIDKYNPELKVKYMDKFGHKNSWTSMNAPELKKQFVIICRKAKVLFSMRDIINLYKPDVNKQLKLF